MSLELAPIDQRTAFEFVAQYHRHSNVPAGAKFCVSVVDQERITRGVAVVGRPVSRALDNGLTLEVTRCCTDGYPNACSMLYGAAWRAAKALGYHKLVTYTLASESGGSLRGAGWRVVAQTHTRGAWDTAARPRANRNQRQLRLRWEAA